jgi:DNA-binding IclR family transcriptional regulator
VHLGRLEGDKVHFIDSIESTKALRVANRLGRSMLRTAPRPARHYWLR